MGYSWGYRHIVNHPNPSIFGRNCPQVDSRRLHHKTHPRLTKARSGVYDELNPKSPRYEEKFPKPIKIGARAIGFSEVETQEARETLRER